MIVTVVTITYTNYTEKVQIKNPKQNAELSKNLKRITQQEDFESIKVTTQGKYKVECLYPKQTKRTDQIERFWEKQMDANKQANKFWGSLHYNVKKAEMWERRALDAHKKANRLYEKLTYGENLHLQP